MALEFRKSSDDNQLDLYRVGHCSPPNTGGLFIGTIAWNIPNKLPTFYSSGPVTLDLFEQHQILKRLYTEIGKPEDLEFTNQII